jgi:Carboxypeptidase regulatory-like domain
MRATTSYRKVWQHLRWGAAMGAALLWAVAALGQDTHPSQEGANAPAAQNQPDAKDSKEHKSSDPLTTKIRIKVTDANDKPVANASVYVRYNESGGFLHHDKLAELSFKTNQEGSVKIPEIPQGKVLIQVIATGWHTYGKWYEIDKDEESVAIKLEAPPHWY